jgi:hypothetical protein
MFKNYLKVAWRNLVKNRVFSFTISFQAIKAAIANPVKSLRTE